MINIHSLFDRNTLAWDKPMNRLNWCFAICYIVAEMNAICLFWRRNIQSQQRTNELHTKCTICWSKTIIEWKAFEWKVLRRLADLVFLLALSFGLCAEMRHTIYIIEENASANSVTFAMWMLLYHSSLIMNQLRRKSHRTQSNN